MSLIKKNAESLVTGTHTKVAVAKLDWSDAAEATKAHEVVDGFESWLERYTLTPPLSAPSPSQYQVLMQ